jgi:membrane-bound ClpP family serine protease
MDKRLTTGRLVIAVVTTSLEETAIYVIWRWLLPEYDIVLSVGTLAVVMGAWLIFSVWLFVFTTRVLKRQPAAGLPSMVGTTGKAAGTLSPEGMVNIRGELWGATSVDGNIKTGEKIVVVGEEGLKLQVRRAAPSALRKAQGKR